VKSSCHSLKSFLSIILDCHLQNSTHFLIKTDCSLGTSPCIASGHESTEHTVFYRSVLFQACLLICCLVIDIILLRVLVPAGRCLLSRCLATGLYVTALLFSSKEDFGFPLEARSAFLLTSCGKLSDPEGGGSMSVSLKYR
jgi:hypothetical protein